MRSMRFMLPLLLVALIFIACKKNKNNKSCASPSFDCAAVFCPAIPTPTNFQFRLVDKITGADLVFGTNSRFTVNDIALYRDISQALPLPVLPDSTNKLLYTRVGREEMYLQVKNTVYKLQAVYDANSCCSATVRQLTMDGKQVCVCCNDVITLAVQ